RIAGWSAWPETTRATPGTNRSTTPPARSVGKGFPAPPSPKRQAQGFFVADPGVRFGHRVAGPTAKAATEGGRTMKVAPGTPCPRSGGLRLHSRCEASPVAERSLASATEWPGPRQRLRLDVGPRRPRRAAVRHQVFETL